MACSGCGPSFVTAAFKSCKKDEAFIFLKDKYIVENYYPGIAKDKVVYGPKKNAEGMHCLKNTVFANGIDCAFATNEANKAYIFSGACVALLEYSACYCPTKAKLVKGPMPISQMFPFLKSTVFETGIDAAFESSICNEAYLFKGDKYARINYCSCDAKLKKQGPIAQFWPCLKDTTFAINIDAAFASHRHNEAYLFKGEYYARIKFTPGECHDKLLGHGVQKIKECWPELTKLLPQPQPSCN